jgi:hypothetical protein
MLLQSSHLGVWKRVAAFKQKFGILQFREDSCEIPLRGRVFNWKEDHHCMCPQGGQKKEHDIRMPTIAPSVGVPWQVDLTVAYR